MKRICLITCYMGPLPSYFNYYTFSCKKNPTIDFIIINNSITKSYVDENIRFIKMSLLELNAHASDRLNEPIELKNAWKINELAPLYANVFDDQIKEYDYWGWCDLDLLWGNIRYFLTDEVLDEFDVITTKELWSAGHFTLFKNNMFCNNLYKRYPGIISLLNNPVYFAFEECCHRWEGRTFSFEELKEKNLPYSMFDIIKDASAKGEIKARFKDIIREFPQPINYIYKDGMLTDLSNNEEFMYYHFLVVKKIWRFYMPPYKPGCQSLIIDPYGIRCENENKLVWFIKRAYGCYLGIRKSIKTQNSSKLIKKIFKRDRAEY